ncbi:MAG: helix-turn-helix domain-containing protein [Clostridiales bacterium]|nr:helix-turn-helix domain-containing protein [Clostridiales bacterium]
MVIGNVIRSSRKRKNMTQEEMADRLGVTASAVNKWEKGNSFPDITLLAPIARLLEISLEELLSFREELTADEIHELIREADQKFKAESYEEVFQWARKKIEEYPNCEELRLNLAVLLDAQRILQNISMEEGNIESCGFEEDRYEKYICSLYLRGLESGKEDLRYRAADSLVGFYMRKGRYEEAEKYLSYYSIQNPERKRKQARIYSETGRTEEAYKAYEELLFSDYQRVNSEIHGMYLLAMKNGDSKKARTYAEKEAECAHCFEMGRYYEVSCKLELAILEQNSEEVLSIMKEMMESVGEIGSFRNAFLYQHMDLKEIRSEFLAELKENLRSSFRDEETFGFLKEDVRWQELVKKEK